LYVGYSVFFFGVIVRLIFRLFRFKDLIIRLVLIGSAVFGVGAFANLMLALVLRIYPELDWDNPYNLTTISMLIELVFFSAAIAYKFRQDEREKQAAQAELIRRLEENQVLAQHLQDIRNRIARDLHDDIGGTLSSISIYTEVARRQLEPTSPIREILDKIARQAVEMVGQMSDTIWTLHPRNDHTGSLIRRMEDVAASLLGAASVQYTFDVSPEAMAAPPSMDQRKNLFLIYKEAVNNVVRHAHATRVTIQAGCEAGHWYLEVADNGTGTQPAPDHTGHGLQNMQVRAQEIGGMLTLTPGPGAGTQIRITVPLPVLGDMSRRPG
jgi:signal transduction histidine kinase